MIGAVKQDALPEFLIIGGVLCVQVTESFIWCFSGVEITSISIPDLEPVLGILI